MPDPAGLELALYSRANAVLTATIEKAEEVRWQEKMDDVGGGAFTLSLDADDAALLDYGQIVRCKIGATTVFGWTIEELERVQVAPNGRAGRVVRAAGRGLLALWEDAIVYPELGEGSNLSGPDRLFNFASSDFDDSAWAAVTTSAGPTVTAWPDTTTQVIWGPGYPAYVGSTPVGECYFRKTFTVAAEGTYRVFCTADDGLDVYVDGVLVFSEVRAFLWQETKYVDVFLEAGTHTIAIRGENITRPDATSNAAWVKAAVYELLSGGGAIGTAPVVQTDGTWKGLAYPANPPGFTPGEVIEILLSEAEARGCLAGLTLGFTASVDSEGTPWASTPDIKFPIGTDYLSVLRQLAEVFCSFRMNPTTLELDAFISLGVDRSATVSLAAGISLGVLQHRGSAAALTNVLLARHPSGAWRERTSAPSITAWGRREAPLSAGAQSSAQIRRLSDATFGEFAQPAVAVTAGAEPLPGLIPWVDYEVGDWISAPDEDGAPADYRVRSVSASRDRAGHPVYVPELGTVLEELQERLLRLTKRMTPGTLSGRIEGASPAPTVFDNPFGRVAQPEIAVFSYPGTLVAGAGSGRYYPNKSVRRVRVLASLGTAGSTATTFTIYKNGASIGTVTIASGANDGSAELATTLSPNVDYLTVATTAAGSGAADAVVRAALS
jgi:hypothetical protein